MATLWWWRLLHDAAYSAIIAMVDYDKPLAVAQAKADLIVRAVNCHAQAIEAATKALQLLREEARRASFVECQEYIDEVSAV
jgi:hypothetical protein